MDDRKQALAEAQAAEKRGNFKAAGEAFARAGRFEDAARAYLGGGDFARAAQALTRVAGERGAAERKGFLLKAAICFSRGGDVPQAVRIFLELGERQRAVDLLRSLGDTANADRVESDRTGHVELAGYAVPASQSAYDLEAARRLEAMDKHEAALEAYASRGLWADAARVAHTLDKHARAATYYAEAGLPFEAGESFLSGGDRDQALHHFVAVKPDDPHYRRACLRAIAICADRSALPFELEQAVAAFVASGPQNDEEQQSFYALALLCETQQSFEHAAACYQAMVARDPGYRDVKERLRACLDEDREASASDYRRIVAEEQGFRSALERHATPVRPVEAWAKDDLARPLPGLPDVPALPDLPDLPDLPPLPVMALMPSAPAQAAASPAAEPLRPGLVIHGRYRLDEKIGQGGMGSVYKAFDLDLEEGIAMKFLATHLVDDEALARFKQEVSLSRQFSHPNVIRMYDLGTYSDQKYITMELLDGEDLGVVLKRESLPLHKTVTLLVQACRALQVVHDHGVVHRDVKPDNFFLTTNGVLKVMDFGIAKRANAAKGLTRAGMTAGTPQYIAPEQASNFGHVTHLADLYALGCIAYRMLTGRVPFDATEVMPILLAHLSQEPVPLRTLDPTLPPELDAIVLRLLAKDPAKRIQSCRELATQLMRTLDSARG